MEWALLYGLFLWNCISNIDWYANIMLRPNYSSLPLSNRKGLGTSPSIFWMWADDPHNQKEHVYLYKIPRFGVNRISETLAFIKKYVECCPDCCPDVHKLFRNCGVLNGFNLIDIAQLTANFGVLYKSLCSFWLCESGVRIRNLKALVPKPLRFEVGNNYLQIVRRSTVISLLSWVGLLYVLASVPITS